MPLILNMFSIVRLGYSNVCSKLFSSLYIPRLSKECILGYTKIKDVSIFIDPDTNEIIFGKSNVRVKLSPQILKENKKVDFILFQWQCLNMITLNSSGKLMN